MDTQTLEAPPSRTGVEPCPQHLAHTGAGAGASAIVQALCHDVVASGVSLDIHTDDEMLHFFLYSQGHDLERATALYLESGRRIWNTLRQIVAFRFGSPARAGRVLDFASGYGRVTRHAVAEVGPGSLWVADIYAEGIAFQERQLGVHGIVSSSDPNREPTDIRFDCILVSSFFSHLSATRFEPWLERLGSLLTPDGLLLFSVHDLALRGDPEASSRRPCLVFSPQSESRSLDVQEYGSSWVNEAYVRRAIERTIGPCPVLRLPRGLASFQDLYVVSKTPTVDLGALRVRREADGFLEHCSRGGGRLLRLSGWVADRVAARPPQEIQVRLDGALVATCRDLPKRPDVVGTFGDDTAEVAGWQAVVELPPGSDRERALLSIVAIAVDGQELDLYSSSVIVALLRTAQLDAAHLYLQMRQRDAGWDAERSAHAVELAARDARATALEARIRTMEASRCWKARNLLVRARNLGLRTSQL